MKWMHIFLSLIISFGMYAGTVDEEEALHLDWRDLSVQPGADFYGYANGTWQKENPIPEKYPSWGSFLILDKKMQELVHQLLIEAAKNKSAQAGSLEQKIGDFYYSGMDIKNIDALGIKPLVPWLQRIEHMRTKDDLQEIMAQLQPLGVDTGFHFFSMQDFKNSEKVIGALVQGGLGLPDRDYYLKPEKQFKDIRTAYIEHMVKMFQLSGESLAKARQDAQVVMRMEMALAKASMSQTEQRDPYAIYHMMKRDALQQWMPHCLWNQYFKNMHQNAIKEINLAMPHFFKCFDGMLHTVSLADWKIYMRWHLLDAFAPYLSQPFVDEDFRMSSVLTGTKKLLPRWERVVATENAALGFAIGEIYVQKYFSAMTKKQVLEILHAIRRVLQKDLRTLDWMTEKTREEALKKLDAMGERVGYPSRWWDYSKLHVHRGPYVLNVMHANVFLFQRDLNKIGKPVDRTEWAMTPQTINAYYDPSMNNINIPAGIMQSPFFDPKAPAAVNYGAIGFVIGHEITHGFDDQGARFDEHGNLKNWWTAEDLKKFEAATACIRKQYDQYKVNGNLSVQGQLVLGEATADLGGMLLAYRAFHASDAYKHAKTIGGLTPDQQFFLGMAHVWAMNMRPEKLQHQVTVDPHPPAVYRVNGTVANMPEFQKAFDLPNHAAMVNVKRCVIW